MSAEPTVPSVADMNFTRHLTITAATTLTVTAAALTIATDAHAASGTFASNSLVEIGSAQGFATGGGVAVNDTAVGTVQPASPYPSIVIIDGMVGQITDVNVSLLDVSHGAAGDLDLMLMSPAGTGVMLMSDAVNGAIGPVTLTFDDEAATDLPPSGLQTGTYRPRDVDAILGEDVFPAPAPAASSAGSALSAFDGQAADGQWELLAVDDEHGDAGAISSWELSVTTTGMKASPSTIQVSGVAGPVTDVHVGLQRLKHTHSADVDMLLVGPAGQQVTLLSDVGTSAPVSDVNLVLRDDAPTQAGPALASGTFRPTNLEGVGTDFYGPAPAPGPSGETSLSVFDGTNPNGAWRLYVGDDRQYGDSGTLAGWSLELVTPDGPVVVTPTPTPQPGAADTTAPRVTSVRPRAKATGVRRGAVVTARLSEPVVSGTVTRRSAYVVAKGSTRRVRAAVAYDPATGSVRIEPIRPLKAATTYRAVLTSAIRDGAGNTLARTVWRFTTR